MAGQCRLQPAHDRCPFLHCGIGAQKGQHADAQGLIGSQRGTMSAEDEAGEGEDDAEHVNENRHNRNIACRADCVKCRAAQQARFEAIEAEMASADMALAATRTVAWSIWTKLSANGHSVCRSPKYGAPEWGLNDAFVP